MLALRYGGPSLYGLAGPRSLEGPVRPGPGSEINDLAAAGLTKPALVPTRGYPVGLSLADKVVPGKPYLEPPRSSSTRITLQFAQEVSILSTVKVKPGS